MQTGVGGRALGMGGAYVAIGDDVTSIYWNPAGLGFLDKGQIFIIMHPQFLFPRLGL